VYSRLGSYCFYVYVVNLFGMIWLWLSVLDVFVITSGVRWLDRLWVDLLVTILFGYTVLVG